MRSAFNQINRDAGFDDIVVAILANLGGGRQTDGELFAGHGGNVNVKEYFNLRFINPKPSTRTQCLACGGKVKVTFAGGVVK